MRVNLLLQYQRNKIIVIKYKLLSNNNFWVQFSQELSFVVGGIPYPFVVDKWPLPQGFGEMMQVRLILLCIIEYIGCLECVCYSLDLRSNFLCLK